MATVQTCRRVPDVTNPRVRDQWVKREPMKDRDVRSNLYVLPSLESCPSSFGDQRSCFGRSFGIVWLGSRLRIVWDRPGAGRIEERE